MTNSIPVDRRFALLLGGAMALSTSPSAAADEADANAVSTVIEVFFHRFQQRDKTAADLFDPTGTLVGSAVGEVCNGRDAILKHLDTIYALPVRIGAEWEQKLVRNDNPATAWFWSEGNLILTDDAGNVTRVPYRLACVLGRKDKIWRIQLFSGSQPVAGH